jgi:hypothetical protein
MLTIFPPFARLAVTLGMAFLAIVTAGNWCTRANAVKQKDCTECALRDVQVLIMIEFHGEAENVSSDKLSDAFFGLMQARASCAAGRVDEALEIYDGVAVALAQAVKK